MPPEHHIHRNIREEPKARRQKRCLDARNIKEVLHKYACPKPQCCKSSAKSVAVEPQKPDSMTEWAWKLKQNHYGAPPDPSHFRTHNFRWQELHPDGYKGKIDIYEDEEPPPPPPKPKYINPFRMKPKKGKLSGPGKRRIVEKWGKMWDSALSDLQFDRTVFENNPDGEQTYRTDNERINDGCQKLCAIARMNQNIITMMMKKFVSGPPSKLYTLNRIEAAQCWDRIINDNGLVTSHCCVDLPPKPRQERVFHIPSLATPKAVGLKRNLLQERVTMFKLPPAGALSKTKKGVTLVDVDEAVCLHGEGGLKPKWKRNPNYWLDPKLVPPVPPGFREEEFHIDPKADPTGEIRRDLQKAKEMAKRYTRFQHIIEKAKHVVPNLERVNQTMDANFVSADERVRRQTLLHNFFSSPKMDTSVDFKKDAMFATILSRNDNPQEAVQKKPFPYSLAEMSKAKLRRSRTNM